MNAQPCQIVYDCNGQQWFYNPFTGEYQVPFYGMVHPHQMMGSQVPFYGMAPQHQMMDGPVAFAPPPFGYLHFAEEETLQPSNTSQEVTAPFVPVSKKTTKKDKAKAKASPSPAATSEKVKDTTPVPLAKVEPIATGPKSFVSVVKESVPPPSIPFAKSVAPAAPTAGKKKEDRKPPTIVVVPIDKLPSAKKVVPSQGKSTSKTQSQNDIRFKEEMVRSCEEFVNAFLAVVKDYLKDIDDGLVINVTKRMPPKFPASSRFYRNDEANRTFWKSIDGNSSCPMDGVVETLPEGVCISVEELPDNRVKVLVHSVSVKT